MNTKQVVKSTCDICSAGCGVLIYVENGKPVRIEGDPSSPINKGAICAKGLASLEYLYHPDRLKHPLKRVGERGEGKWQQILWDDALSVIAEELTRAKDNYGAQSVAFIAGSNKGVRDNYLVRFANVFGSPNHTWAGYVCFMPRRLASVITCGFDPFPDYEYPPACLVIWGSHVLESRIFSYYQTIESLNRGTKLIVVDPRRMEFTSRADFWLQLRPGTDLALALGMINVIVNEDLFDKAFVNNWTVGFEKLRAHVQDYPLEKVEEITWVPAEIIRQAARFYATHKPACFQLGNAIDHNVNSFQTARAISILRAITGNLGVPGGEAQWVLRGSLNSPELRLDDKMPEDKWERRVEAEHKVLPIVREGLPQSIVKAILYEDPYPIRMAYVQGCNALLSWANAQETYKALKKLDFTVVSDIFMTPTAALADIVLPAATYLEFDSVVAPPYYPAHQIQQKVAEVGECRSDCRILIELAKKLGLGQYFWDDEEKALDEILKPGGLTFNEFRKVGVILGSKQYRSYEGNGFETPSRKVELYSSQLKEWGFDPLPTYHELPETQYSNPELVREYPLIFSSCKWAPFRHSGGRQIATLRGSYPEPVISIHPETASKLAIKEGDWIYIETKRGRIKQKATLSTDIDPRVVWVDYGWWFPEKGISNLYGWAESNINVLTDDKPPYNREMGSTNLRGILCKVYKD